VNFFVSKNVKEVQNVYTNTCKQTKSSQISFINYLIIFNNLNHEHFSIHVIFYSELLAQHILMNESIIYELQE